MGGERCCCASPLCAAAACPGARRGLAVHFRAARHPAARGASWSIVRVRVGVGGGLVVLMD